MRVRNLDELRALQKDARCKMLARLNNDCDGANGRQILVCGGTGCTSSGSKKIIDRLEQELRRHHLEGAVSVVKTGCFGLCALGPVMIVYPEGCFYSAVSEENVPKIVEEHIIGGVPVRELLYHETVRENKIAALSQTSFYAKQHRVVLKNCGLIAPEDIEEYVAVGGYAALHKALTTMTPQSVIDEIKAAGLRGRGGGGFPTGTKWEIVARGGADGGEKYICCNADEGDPGAFMDRSILEGDPHAVLESMAIAGYSVGATRGYIYVRAEYPIAVQRLTIALRQAREYGFLGENIFGTTFNFDIELRLGAGAFVCGEETALITSIEGHRGEPHPRPPFPAASGLFGRPTVINNVETYANVARIIQNGAEWFRKLGTVRSPGTKVFALGGRINHTGLVEVPMGTTLREIVEEIGGGIPGEKAFKAAQTGGPSGGCIPAKFLDVAIDYDKLTEIGSMMGSGGLIVMDEGTCMVDIAKFFLEFTVDESCGKCTPCRVGTKRLLEMLQRIASGRAEPGILDEMEELCHYIKANSLCGLGQTAPNPVLSTLKYFRDEYEAHILQKKCPAGVCRGLVRYEIDQNKCRGCTACARGCPVGAISGSVGVPHVIDQNLCVRCGTCREKCRFGAVQMI